MEDRAALLTRIDALIQKLERVKDAFRSTVIEESMRESVLIRVGNLVDGQVKKLKSLEASAGSGVSAARWKEFTETRRACDGLFRETLAFLGGVLMRDVDLDEGICSVADQLLAELEYGTDIRWSRRTILGEGASFDRVAEIIRVPYPEFEVWTLPSVAHEFGHLVARKLKGLEVLVADQDTEPFEDLLDDEEARGTKDERFLHELFSDVLATYAQGPAFLCLSVALRFEPSSAHWPTQSHPPAAERVHVMLGTLERMQASDPVRPYDSVIARVRERWGAALRGAGQPERLEEGTKVEDVKKLDRRLEEIYGLHEEHLPQARYDGWLRAQRLSGYVDGDDLSQPVAKLADEDALADVLNAAWWWRIQRDSTDWLGIRRADRIARALCDAIVAKRRGDTS